MPLFSSKDKRREDPKPSDASGAESDKTQEAFILQNILSSLAFLQSTNYLKQGTVDKIRDLIDRDQNGTDEDEELGPKNRRIREWLIEDEVIPELVNQVVGIVSPVSLSFLQEEALTALTEKYSPHIAKAVTNPVWQEKATSATVNAAATSSRAIAEGYRSSRKALQQKDKAQELAEAAHQERMAELRELARSQKKNVLEVTREGLTTTHQVDEQTTLHATTYSPKPGTVITSCMVCTCEPANEEDASAAETPNAKGAVPPPPPRHPRGAVSIPDRSFDPPLPPRRGPPFANNP